MPVFTFGASHVCPQCGLSLRNSYVELPTRDAMVALFGIKWSRAYASPVFAGVDSFGLKQIMPNGDCACGGMGQLAWGTPDRAHRQVIVEIVSEGDAHCVMVTGVDGGVIDRVGPFDSEAKAQGCYEKTLEALKALAVKSEVAGHG